MKTAFIIMLLFIAGCGQAGIPDAGDAPEAQLHINSSSNQTSFVCLDNPAAPMASYRNGTLRITVFIPGTACGSTAFTADTAAGDEVPPRLLVRMSEAADHGCVRLNCTTTTVKILQIENPPPFGAIEVFYGGDMLGSISPDYLCTQENRCPPGYRCEQRANNSFGKCIWAGMQDQAS